MRSHMTRRTRPAIHRVRPALSGYKKSIKTLSDLYAEILWKFPYLDMHNSG
jgi:hypothetical protein